MDKKKYWIIRLFFVLFTISVSVAILPCGIINVHGLFGEVTTYVVVEDKEQEIVSIEDVDHKKVQTVKGINILNIWFEICQPDTINNGNELYDGIGWHDGSISCTDIWRIFCADLYMQQGNYKKRITCKKWSRKRPLFYGE